MNIANPPLPPGFRFHPTDQELIIHYLKKKVSSSQTPIVSIIADIDLYKYNPWDLPGKALFGEGEWFFFSPRERKYPNGARPNRAAASGYWKATGTDKPILATAGSQCIGVKKALVFYKGRPPKGSKTEWVMHEYRLLDNTPTSQKLKGSMRLDDWVLCRVRQKSTIPFQIGEKQDDSPSSSHHSFENNPYMDNQVMRERNDFLQDSDYQVLQNVMGSQEQGAGVCWNYNPCVLGPNKASKVDAIPQGGEGPQPPLVSSVQQILDSIKRIPSFGGFEEYLLLHPNKRLHIGGGSADEQSPTNSASMSSCFPEFTL